MKWIELVIVRAVDEKQRTAAVRLIDHLVQNHRPDELKKIILFRNAIVDSDIAVHLQWEVAEKQPAKSGLGLGLATGLEEWGRVHHTLWIEDPWCVHQP